MDPVIARLGLAPSKRPYGSPTVKVVIDDARSFLQKAADNYDLIAFGFLDSHRLFSPHVQRALDNYVSIPSRL